MEGLLMHLPGMLKGSSLLVYKPGYEIYNNNRRSTRGI
jgi:hypothetical protein